jgi:hypothetical protein
MPENTKIPAAQNSIEDPPEYNAESAKNLAAQKDQSPTFDQLSADLQNLISQLNSFMTTCLAMPIAYQSSFPAGVQIMQTFCSPNENAEKGEPMTVSDAYSQIRQLS